MFDLKSLDYVDHVKTICHDARLREDCFYDRTKLHGHVHLFLLRRGKYDSAVSLSVSCGQPFFTLLCEFLGSDLEDFAYSLLCVYAVHIEAP